MRAGESIVASLLASPRREWFLLTPMYTPCLVLAHPAPSRSTAKTHHIDILRRHLQPLRRHQTDLDVVQRQQLHQRVHGAAVLQVPHLRYAYVSRSLLNVIGLFYRALLARIPTIAIDKPLTVPISSRMVYTSSSACCVNEEWTRETAKARVCACDCVCVCVRARA